MARRVLIIVEGAGRSRYYEAAAPMLLERGFQPCFATIGPPGPLGTELAKAGIECHSIPWRTSSTPQAVLGLRRRITTIKPDLVHAHEAIPAALAALARPLTPTPARWIYHRHSLRPRTHRQIAYNSLARRGCDWVFAVSGAVSELTMAEGVAFDRVLAVENGVPAPAPCSATVVDSLRSALGISRDDHAVLLISRGRPGKGHHVALLALAETRRRGLPVHLVSVGPPGRLPLREGARALGVADAFHDLGPKDDIDPWLALADLCIVPSLDEAFGLVAIESFATGTPVVASATGGLREIVRDGSTGRLAVPGSSLSLADCIQETLEDPDKRRAMGSAALVDYESRYSTDAMVDRWVRAYELILSS